MFNNKKILSVLLAVVMLVQTLAIPNFAADVSGFKDFPTNSWSEEAVMAALDNGLLVGTSETTIEPRKNLTRAEFAAIITRAFGATEKADISMFKDVKEGKWYCEPIAKAVQMGVMNGTGDTTFAPDAFMKREDVILALARVLFVDGEDTSVLNQFSDSSDIDTWAVKAIAGMVNENYVNGYEDGTIRPKNLITREELAQLFHNIFKTYISKEGEYNSVAKKGSVVVRSADVSLKNVTVNGDLILADGIGDGDFRLTNVHVTGKIIARGGEGMVYFVDVTSDGKVIVNDPNGTVNFYNYREEDTPFKGGNVIENTPATFLEREKDDKPSSIGGVGTTYKVEFKNEDDSTVKKLSKSNKNYVIKETDVPTDDQMEKVGYEFKGWSMEGSVEVYKRDWFIGKKIGDVKGVYYPVYVEIFDEYTITFVTDSGDVVVTKKENEKLVSSDIPSITVDDTKEFLGWTTVPGSTNVDYTNDELTADIVENIFSTTDVKLYPVIREKGVTEIIFKHPDEDKKVTKYDDPDYVLTESDVPADPTKSEYTFEGWAKNPTAEDGEDRSYFVGKKISEVEGTWYPIFKKIVETYSVSFKFADGTEALSTVEKTLALSEDYVLTSSDVHDVAHPTAPADYKFLGWTTTADGTDYKTSAELQISIKSLENVYYAQFEKVTDNYTVVFKYTDGTEIVKVEKTLSESEDYTLTSSEVYDVDHPTDPSDYKFLGWTDTIDGTDYKTSAELQTSIKTLDGKTYYAQFEKIEETYSVSFKFTDGTTALDTVEKTLAPSEDYFLKSSDVYDVAHPTTPSDYEFLGWTETVDGTDYKTSAELRVSIKSLDGKTFYAQFKKLEETYSVSFKFNDGTEALSTVEKTLAPSEDYVLTSSDVRDVAHPTAPADYKFIGWAETANGTTVVSSADLEKSIKDLDGKTYYAQFEKVTDNYTVVFKYVDGVDINRVEKTLSESEDYTLTSSDVNDVDYHTNPADYKFLGWTDTIDGTDYKTSAELRVSIKDLDGKTYYAQFAKLEETYKVSFMYTDGTEINKVEKNLAYSENYVLSASDVYDVDYHTNPGDYIFLGWTTTVDGTDYKTSAELQISIKDLENVYYAQFEKIEDTYSVSFKFNDGADALSTVTKTLAPSEDYVLTSSDVHDVAHPTAPADYKFIGWATTVDGTDYKTSAELQTSIKDLDGKTYYAQFEKVTDNYTVVFKYTDGTEIVKVEKTLSESEEYILTSSDVYDVDHPTTPSDYKFLGWTTTVDGTDYKTSAELRVSIKDLDGKTYYAQFEKIEETYKVSFVYTDGVAINEVEKTLAPSEDYTLTSFDVSDVDYHTNPGDYIFLGWTTTVDGTDYKTSAELQTSIKTLDGKTYYAQFEKIEDTYSVSFKYNDGTEALSTVEKTLAPSEDYVLTSSDVHDVAHPTAPADYKFIGWATTVDGTDYKTSAELQTSIKDLDGKTYYAQFEKVTDNYTVVFKYTDGTEIVKVEKTLSESEDYTLTSSEVYDVAHPTAPSDYKFLGWTDTIDGTDYKTSAELQTSIKTLDGKTYYAQFESLEETYKVSFMYTDGVVINEVEKTLLPSEDYVLTSSDVSDVAHPTAPSDYKFLGWTETVDGTDYKTSAELQISVKDLDGKTYYAQFESLEETYKVSFMYTDGVAINEAEKTLLPSEDYTLTSSDVYDVDFHTNPDEYTFLGWTTTVDGADYKTSAELQVSIRDLDGKTFYAQFKHIDDVVYTVEHYFEQVDGTYTLEETETFYEKPGVTVTAAALTTLPDGYKPYAGVLPEGVVAEDGSLVLELYYELEVISVEYYDLAIDEVNPVLTYEVKYGGTIDNFYYPGDVYDAAVNEDIKAEIDEYLEYIKIAGYGKNYDDEYLYTKFEDKLSGNYYPMYPHFEYDYEHAINFKWYVEDDVEEFVLFDKAHVFTEDLDLFSKVKKLNVEISFNSKLTDEVLTLNIPYEESTRFLDSIRDALFINDNVATFPDMTGVEEAFYDKISNVGGKVFGSDGILNDQYEINKTDVMVYFYQMMGGKKAYQDWLWEEVETEVENSLGPRGEDTPRSQYESLRSSGLNQEKALYAFFIENRFDLDFDDDLAFAYGRYIDSKKFIEMSSNEDQFLVTAKNDFIMERVEEKIASLASVDSVIAEYGKGKVPAGLVKRIPSDITDIYDLRVEKFLDSLQAAREEAKKPSPDVNVCMVDSGIYFDVNLVGEVLIPMMEYAEKAHNKAVDKAVASGNKAAELVEKYYVDNPYTTGKAGNYGAVNYAFNPSFYVSDEDGDGLYTINSFESIYNNVVMPESVETIDAFIWYMDPEGGSVDITKLTNLVRENEDLVLALHNHTNNLMAKYAVEGLPEDMVTYWNDLLSDPEIAAAVEKLDNKVDSFKNFDMAFFVETKIQNATLEMYYLKILDKAGVPMENILGKYTNSKAYKELTHEDLEKLLCQLEECWATVEVEIDGVMVPVENAIGTTDYVFDNVLEKVGKSGNVAEAYIKGFGMKLTRFFADDLFQVAP